MSARRTVTRGETTLAAALAILGLRDDEARAAIGGGRVFVGRERARSIDRAIGAGVEVIVHAPRAAIALPEPFVLHHARGLLAVDKPAGIPTIPDLVGAEGSLVDLAARAIGVEADALHPTSRLDREVSGVVVFALDDRARDALAKAREEGAYARRYLAIAKGGLPRDRDRWEWAIARDRDPRKRRAVDRGAKDAKASSSRVLVASRVAPYLLLLLAPDTGRTHQLRVHAARAGAPLLGDGLYGGTRTITSATGAVRAIDRIALHCASVEIALDGGGEKIRLRSPVPPELVALAVSLGLARDASTFDEILACDV